MQKYAKKYKTPKPVIFLQSFAILYTNTSKFRKTEHVYTIRNDPFS